MTEIATSIGSIWRRWDLHIHTPASMVNHYGGIDPWDRFLTELSSLPPEMSVVGINDYLFVDGYRRVLEAFRSGRLPNLEAIFPVIELRLTQLAGVEGELRRINYHVIFEQQFDPDTIEAQFVNGLAVHYQLTPGGAPWSGFPTESNLAALGRQIRADMPAERQREHQESDLQLGFSNLAVSLEHIQGVLGHSSLRGRSITAIGKAEWASLRWTEQSIATKKHIINQADVVFTAAESPEAYERGRHALVQQGVNDHLLDCSDAHSWLGSSDKDRLGNCWTWINAQPTLEGLRHALTEFDHRVYVGELPTKLQSLRLRAGDHICRVAIRRAEDSLSSAPALFNTELALNPGFVAVVGNKGKGKSALLDAIGLAGDCSTEQQFTFLSKERFRNPSANRAADHAVELAWCDGAVVKRRLDSHVSATSPPRVTYLPQRMLDLICSADPGEPSTAFSQELEKVLFAHVPPADRLGTTSLRSLIDARAAAIDGRLGVLRSELSTLNRRIVETEDLRKPDRRAGLVEAKEQLTRRLQALEEMEPKLPAPVPDAGDPALADQIADIRSRHSELDREIRESQLEDASLARAINLAEQLRTDLGTLKNQVETFRQANAPRAEAVDISIDEVLTFELDETPLHEALARYSARRDEVTQALSTSSASSFVAKRDEAEAELREAQDKLELPARLRAEAEARHRSWATACEELRRGSAEQQGIEEVNRDLEVVDAAPGQLASLHSDRAALSQRILTALLEKVSICEELYRPARSFIDGHALAARCQLTFGARLRERDLAQRFFDIVSRGKVGTFMGLEEGSAQLRERVERVSFADANSVAGFLIEMDEALHADLRTPSAVAIDPGECLRAGHALERLYDLVFGLSYLEPHYSLQYQNTDLDGLSPGEKGTLLLMFYLVVDPGRCPILLDQPDENLDNQTVKDILVPAIKEASTRRQVIAVTHNPNVAIVADADQVIVAEHQADGFSYDCGAIEDGLINKDAVDVLEGTWAAFRNRQDKYQPPEGRSGP